MYKRLTFLTFLAIGILLMGLCFQGIDLADEGFWMANAKYVFSHPEGILYSFSYYLSVLVSGVWGRYVSDTLLGYRLLAALVRMATMLMAYFCLRRFVRRGPLLVGLFWGFLLSCGYTNVLYGSMFTGLFYVSISALLILGVRALLAERSRWAMVVFAIGGFLMGVSVFVRIPNITSLGFVCVPFYALVVFHQLNFRKVSIALLPIMMGWGLGFSAVLGLIHILGHAEHFTIMMEMFREIAKGGHHSIGLLVWVQLRYYISAFFFSGIVLVAMFIGALLMKKLAESMTARGAGVLSHMLMLVGVVALFAGCLIGYNHRLFRVIPVGLFLFSFACAFVRASSELRVVWFTAFVLLGLAPLGSDVPFEANAFSLPFVMPLCVSAFWNGDANFRLAIDRLFGERICGLMIKWTLSTLAILALYGAWHDVVRDNSDRFSLNASVQIREFKGVFTTSERARALENLVLVAERILPPKDPILIFPGLSVLHAILDRPPALECSRVNLYDKSTIYNAMQKGVARVQGKFPWIIEEKWSDGHLWPLARISYMPEGSRLYSFYLQFRRFLDDYSYTLAWENEDFRIWMKNIR